MHDFDYVSVPLDTALDMNYWWYMGIDQWESKVDELVRMILPLYFSIELLVDEVLYNIVWYGPLMVEVFTLFPIYMWCDYGLKGNCDMNL